MNGINVDLELDLSNLQCPMPLLKAKLALNGLRADQILKVIATDPGSEKDFHLFIRQSKHQILEFKKEQNQYCYWIKKGQ
jgi:tRNA 2-thiouridine synthesizing protein A